MSASLAKEDLLITRVFNAPPALVFSMWSRPEHLRRWMGPQTFDCPVAELDFRVGGAYRVLIRSEEKGDNWFGGVYREIEPDRRLVFTFAWEAGPSAGVETIITLTFEERDGKTVQIFHQAPFISAERRDSQQGGWQSAFDKLQAYAERITEERAA